MNDTNVDRSPEEVAEIEKHKYFLSEQMGHDVGWEMAEHDWESNHADAFRRGQSEASDALLGGGVGTLLKRVFTKKRR